MEFDFALLPGDYVGPEVTAEAVKVVDEVGRKFGHVFRWHRDEIGGAAIDAYGVPLRDGTVEMARKCDAILFGAAGGPKWDDPKGGRNQSDTALLKLRKALDLYANLRIVKVFPALTDASTLKPEVIDGVDLIILRELTSGLYFGQPKEVWQTPEGRRAVDTMSYAESEITRILRVGFELARARTKKLLSVDKSNVLETGRLWRQIAMELSPEYPDVELRHMYVDAAAMVLVRDPKSMDVVVMENTFGDILSDEAAMLAGSLGMLPSASLAGPPVGKVFGLYEPIHGSDPPRAGKFINNPIAAILSGALMLRYSCQLQREAHAIEQACSKVLDDGYRTWDIMQPGKKQIGMREMGDLVAGALST